MTSLKVKNLSVVAMSVFAFASAFAGESTQVELAKLKGQREAAIAKFTQSIDKEYVKELNKLQDKALTVKDLDGAIAVKNELKLFGVNGVTTTNTVSFNNKDDIKKFIVGNSFKYIGSNATVFKMNEDGSVSGIGNFLTGWKITGGREVTFTGWDHKMTLVFDMSSDWKSGKLNTKKSTKKDEKVGEFVLNTDEVLPEKKVEASVSTNNEDPDNTLFGRRVK